MGMGRLQRKNIMDGRCQVMKFEQWVDLVGMDEEEKIININ
jgi:hypothetical protein